MPLPKHIGYTFMKKTTFIFCCLITLFVSACYTDDSSIPDPTPLSFDTFEEFFAENRAQRDTLSFSSDELTILAPAGGNTLTIPVDAFSEEGDLRIAFLEASSKSDFILYNWPTVSGDTWLETSEAMFVEAFDGTNPIDSDNPLMWELDVFSGSSPNDLSVYRWDSDWNLQSDIEVTEGPQLVQFAGGEDAGFVAGKELDLESVELAITTTAFGNIPHDMKVFVSTVDGNTVIPLDSEVSTVTASGSVPKGVDLNLIIMVMDYYRLDATVESINLSDDSNIEIALSKMEVDELINMIRQID